MRTKFKIRKMEGLIQFVEETNLPFDDYGRIVEKFTNQKFVWLTDPDKGELIKFLNQHKDKIPNGHALPIFLGNGINPDTNE